MSRIWDFIIDLLVAVFHMEGRLDELEKRIDPLSQEVEQLSYEVKKLRDELHPQDLAAVRWHVGIPRGEK